MDPTMLGPVTGPLALSLELALDTGMNSLADWFYGWILMLGPLGL